MKSYLRLKAYRSALIKQAARRLINDQDADITKEIRCIKDYDSLLAMLPRRRILDLLAAIVVAGICMGTMWFLWASKMPRTKVLLNIQTKYVRFNVAERPERNDPKWVWEGNLPLTSGKSLRLENLTPDEVITRYMDEDESEKNFYLHSGMGKVWLVALRAAVDGELRLEYNDNDLVELRYDGQEFSGMLSFQRNGDTVSSKAPEEGRFGWNRGGGARPRLEMGLLENWSLFNIPIRAISFVSSIPAGPDPGERISQSRLIHGLLRYTETGQERELEAGDVLEMRGLTGRLVSMEIREQDKTINLRYEGQVKELRWGPKGFDVEITPSILDYWFHKKSLAFFASVFMSLGGFLWSIRKWLIS